MFPPKQFEKIVVPTNVLLYFVEDDNEDEDVEDDDEAPMFLNLELGIDNSVIVTWVNYEAAPEECLTIGIVFANKYNEEISIVLTLYEEHKDLYEQIEYTGEILDYTEVLTHSLKGVREAASLSYRRDQDEAD